MSGEKIKQNEINDNFEKFYFGFLYCNILECYY